MTRFAPSASTSPRRSSAQARSRRALRTRGEGSPPAPAGPVRRRRPRRARPAGGPSGPRARPASRGRPIPGGLRRLRAGVCISVRSSRGARVASPGVPAAARAGGQRCDRRRLDRRLSLGLAGRMEPARPDFGRPLRCGRGSALIAGPGRSRGVRGGDGPSACAAASPRGCSGGSRRVPGPLAGTLHFHPGRAAARPGLFRSAAGRGDGSSRPRGRERGGGQSAGCVGARDDPRGPGDRGSRRRRAFGARPGPLRRAHPVRTSRARSAGVRRGRGRLRRSETRRRSAAPVRGRRRPVRRRFPSPAPGSPSPPTAPPELSDEILLRVVLGPEAAGFAPEQVRRFFASPWRVTPESDRRGLRLEGDPLEHLGVPEIAPSGTVPGTVQVPGSGLPIVLGPGRSGHGGLSAARDGHRSRSVAAGTGPPGSDAAILGSHFSRGRGPDALGTEYD